MTMKPRTALLEQSSLQWEPPQIKSFEDTGLSHGFLQDLVLKLLYFRGQMAGNEISEAVCLPFQSVVGKVMEFLRREQYVEVIGSGGLTAATFQYSITSKGGERARERLERTTYVGPAPVPWEDYIATIKGQGTQRLKVNPQTMKKALSHLILDQDVFERIGPAANSGKSLFLYGPPGNGKTTIAESIGRMILTNDIYIPYAVEIEGQIIKIYDEINHVAIPEIEPPRSATGNLNSRRTDQRWIKIKRPVIMVGGELGLDGLELMFDPINKYYEAPFQMKANGGMFLIDDFGRQQVRPRDLLNRWIVPMEKQIDFLALHTGQKIEVPFEVLIVFSTNLPPGDLVDEAFLRRIRHKIEVKSPSFDGFREIFKRVVKARNVEYDEAGLQYLLKEYYVKPKRKLRANHPRDIIEQLIDIADYHEIKPELSKNLLDRAAESYFVKM